MDLSLPDIQRDVVAGDDAREPLRYVTELNNVFRVFHIIILSKNKGREAY